MISNAKVRAYIEKKKKAKDELKRFRQMGGERGAAARKAKGIHGKLDIDDQSASDEEIMDVASSESEEEEKQAAVALAKVKARKTAPKLARKKITK